MADRRLLEPAEARVIERVQQELAEMLEAADREGGRYARAYALYVFGLRERRPKAQSLHPMLARLIRETVLENTGV